MQKIIPDTKYIVYRNLSIFINQEIEEKNLTLFK